MKILFIAAKFYPNLGGVQKHVYELSQELIKKGHSVTLIVEAFGSNRAGKNEKPLTNDVLYKKYDGIDVYYVNFGPWGFTKKFRIWLKMLRFWKLVRDSDIVHCHDVFFWYLPLRFVFPNKPVFTTFHGYESVPPKRKGIFIRRLSDKLSWGSVIIGDFISKWYGTPGDLVLYGGIDKVPTLETSRSFSNKPIRILLLARLDPDVGVLTYIEAFKLLKKRKIPFILDICGDGPYKKEAAKYGKDHGFVTNVNDYIKKADVVFAATYLATFESLAYGKLVCAAYEDEVRKNYFDMSPLMPWIVLTNSPEKLVDAVITFRDKRFILPHRKDINAFLKNNTWEKMAEKHVKLWRKYGKKQN